MNGYEGLPEEPNYRAGSVDGFVGLAARPLTRSARFRVSLMTAEAIFQPALGAIRELGEFLNENDPSGNWREAAAEAKEAIESIQRQAIRRLYEKDKSE